MGKDVELARESVVIAACLTILVFVTPARQSWARGDAPWWLPYGLWALAVAAGFWVWLRWRHHVE